MLGNREVGAAEDRGGALIIKEQCSAARRSMTRRERSIRKASGTRREVGKKELRCRAAVLGNGWSKRSTRTGSSKLYTKE